MVNPLINANNGPGPARLVDDGDTELARGFRLRKGQTVRVVHEPTEAVIAEHTISAEQKPWDGTDDSDGDGVSDKEEGNRDEDDDGTSNFASDDTDGDGVPDHIEGDETEDADKDGNPNYKDKDSDGDFVPDSVEYDPDAPATESTNADGDWYFKDYDSSPSDEHASPLSVSGTTVSVDERHQITFTNDITYDGSEEWATENKNPDDGTLAKHVPPHAISVSKTLSKAKQSSSYESLTFVNRLSQITSYSPTTTELRYSAPDIGDTSKSATATVSAGGDSGTTDITVNVNKLRANVESGPDSLQEDEQGTFTVEVTDADGDVPADEFMPSVTASPGDHGKIVGSDTKTPGSDGKASFTYEATVEDSVFNSKDDSTDTDVSFSTDGTTRSKTVTINSHPDLEFESTPSTQTVDAGSETTLTVEVQNEYGETPSQSHSVSASVSSDDSNTGNLDTNSISVNGKDSVEFTYTAPERSTTDTVTYTLDGEEASTTINVNSPSLSITSVSPSSATIDPDTSKTITVSVANEFGNTPQQSASVSASFSGTASGSIADSDNKKSVKGKDSVEFTYNAPKDGASDTITFSLDGSSKSTSITVREPSLSITSVSPSSTTIDPDTSTTIEVWVINEFDQYPHQSASVSASVDGDGSGSLNTTSQSVNGEQSVKFEYTAPKDGASDTVTFSLDDSSKSTSITVREPSLSITSVSPSSTTIDPDTSTTIEVWAINEFDQYPHQSASVSASVDGDGSGSLNTTSQSVNGEQSVKFKYTAPKDGASDTVTFSLDSSSKSSTISVNEPDLSITSVSPSSPTINVDASKTITVSVANEFDQTPDQSASVSASFDGTGSGSLNTTSQSVKGEDSVAFKYTAPSSTTTDTVSFSLDSSKSSSTITVEQPDLKIDYVNGPTHVYRDGSGEIKVNVQNENDETPTQSMSLTASVSGSGSLNTTSRSVKGKDWISFTYNAPSSTTTDTVSFSIDGSTDDEDVEVVKPKFYKNDLNDSAAWSVPSDPDFSLSVSETTDGVKFTATKTTSGSGDINVDFMTNSEMDYGGWMAVKYEYTPTDGDSHDPAYYEPGYNQWDGAYFTAQSFLGGEKDAIKTYTGEQNYIDIRVSRKFGINLNAKNVAKGETLELKIKPPEDQPVW